MKPIFEYLDYRQYMQDFIHAKKASNPAYSFRYVAQSLQCDAGFFTRIIKGQRNLSQEHMLKIGKIFRLDSKEKSYLELLVQFNQAKKQLEKDHYFEQLQKFRMTRTGTIAAHQYAMLEHWYYVVIRELLSILPWREDIDSLCRDIAGYLAPRRQQPTARATSA
ncbi:MAG: TIGR02147 family protein [Chitinivibrionales bacterium]|nr:TIGR02147 family protein [Chitinivibrionales bacterium]